MAHKPIVVDTRGFRVVLNYVQRLMLMILNRLRVELICFRSGVDESYGG